MQNQNHGECVINFLAKISRRRHLLFGAALLVSQPTLFTESTLAASKKKSCFDIFSFEIPSLSSRKSESTKPAKPQKTVASTKTTKKSTPKAKPTGKKDVVPTTGNRGVELAIERYLPILADDLSNQSSRNRRTELSDKMSLLKIVLTKVKEDKALTVWEQEYFLPDIIGSSLAKSYSPARSSKSKSTEPKKKTSVKRSTSKGTKSKNADHELARKFLEELRKEQSGVHVLILGQKDYMLENSKRDDPTELAIFNDLFDKFDDIGTQISVIESVVEILEAGRPISAEQRETLADFVNERLSRSRDKVTPAKTTTKPSSTKTPTKARSKKRPSSQTASRKPIFNSISSLLDGLNKPRSSTFPHLRDGVASEWIFLNARKNAMSLLVGNNYEAIKPEKEKLYLATAKSIIDAGFYVLYDGESRIAAKMNKVVGKYGVAICARPATINRIKFSRAVVIENPYLRMEAFQETLKAITSRDSITGLGLMLNHAVDYILDPSRTWTDGISKFVSKSSRFGFGLTQKTGCPILNTDPDALAEILGTSASELKPLEPFNLKKYAETFYEADERHVINLATSMTAGIEMLTKGSSGESIAGGAALFGSSSHPGSFAQLTYNLVYTLGSMGIPIVTGGDDIGVMRLGNAAAYDSGTHSIGIRTYGPEFKRVQDDLINNPTKYQTRTIAAYGYHSRIPLLLHRRQVIAAAPGGTGTMRELGTAFVAAANHSSKQSPLYMFIGTDYYEPLYKWLKAESSLPLIFKKSLSLIESSKDVSRTIKNYTKNFSAARTKLLKDKPSYPRHGPRNINY